MPLLGQLIETVEQLIKEHEQLLQLAERKKRVLIDGDMESLQEIVNREVQAIRKVEKLETERMKQGERIAAAYGLKVEELTASKLAAMEPDPQRAARFNLLTGRFVKVMGELSAANDLNGQLIQQSLDLVQRSIDLLTVAPDALTYTGKGDTEQASGPRRFFDSKA